MTWQLSIGYIFFLVLALWFVFVIANYATHRRFFGRQRNELLLITIPLGSEVQPSAAQHTLSEIGATAELLQRLSRYHITFAFEAAVHHVGEEIHFYLYIPKRFKKEIVRDIENIFSNAKITPSDYDIWMEGGSVQAAVIKQSKPYLVPLKAASAPTSDVFAGMLRRLSNLKIMGEGAAIQWVMRPLAEKTKNEMVELLSQLKSGAATSFKHLHEGFLVTPQTIEVLEEKITSPLYTVSARVVVAHTRADEAKRLLRELEESFTIPGSSMLYNELYFAKPTKPIRTLALFSRRVIDPKESMVLNNQEIAAMFHFPTRHASGVKTS